MNYSRTEQSTAEVLEIVIYMWGRVYPLLQFTEVNNLFCHAMRKFPLAYLNAYMGYSLARQKVFDDKILEGWEGCFVFAVVGFLIKFGCILFSFIFWNITLLGCSEKISTNHVTRKMMTIAATIGPVNGLQSFRLTRNTKYDRNARKIR